MPGYFTRIEPDADVLAAYVVLLDTIKIYQRGGRLREAAMMEEALLKLREDFERHGRRLAQKAEGLVRDRLRQTQKRADTPGPAHLRDKIVARPIPSTFPAGAVGIGDLDTLETAVNPRTGGVYWRAQEFGLPVSMRGKPAPGYFMPGMSPPNPQGGRHPYFEQMPYARGMPALVRTRPVPARHYLRDGAQLAFVWHQMQSRRLIGQANVRIAAV